MKLLNLRAKKGLEKRRKYPGFTLDEAFEKMRILSKAILELAKIYKLIVWIINTFFS